MLSAKFDVARKYGIDIEYNIEIPVELPFEDTDLCIIVGNALDNAIDGTKGVDYDKKIVINMEMKQGNFLLKVRNTFNRTSIKYEGNGNCFHTSKTDKNNHGMGIGLIKETALKYDGLAEISMRDTVFTLSVLLYQK